MKRHDVLSLGDVLGTGLVDLFRTAKHYDFGRYDDQIREHVRKELYSDGGTFFTENFKLPAGVQVVSVEDEKSVVLLGKVEPETSGIDGFGAMQK